MERNHARKLSAPILGVGLLLLSGYGVISCCTRGSGSGGSSHYWVHGCVVTDESVLAVAGTDGARIDARSGKLLGSRAQDMNDVLCLSDGRTLGIRDGEAIDLATGAKLEGPAWGGVGWSVLGWRSDGSAVAWWRSTSEDAEDIPLEIASLRISGGALHRTKSVALDPQILAQPAASIALDVMRMVPAGVLTSGEALFIVGRRPNLGFGGVDKKPWWFYAIDAETGKARTLGPANTGDDTVNLYNIDQADVTHDGTRVVMSMRSISRKKVHVVVRDTATASELLRVPVAGSRETSAIHISDSGRRFAVGALSTDGGHGWVVVYDIPTGKVVWKSPARKGQVTLVRILKGGDVVAAYGSHEAFRYGSDGRVVWSAK